MTKSDESRCSFERDWCTLIMVGSGEKRDSTYLIRNAPSDKVDAESPSDAPDSEAPSGRWRTSSPPPGESLEAKWWPDRELGRAFRRWTGIPPARGDDGRAATLKFLEERLEVTNVTAVGTAPRSALPAIAPPDFSSRTQTMVMRLGVHGPNEEAPDHQALLELGVDALPSLQALFPGRLWFSRWEPHVQPPNGSSVSALCRTLVAFGEAAVPFVVELLTSTSEEIRYYAILVAAELPYPALIEPLATALFDDDQGVSRVALYALEAFQDVEGIDSVRDSLRALATSPETDQRSRLLAMRALAVLRDERSVEVLIPMLSERSVIGEAAWRILRMLTAQDFGTDGDAWHTWWERHNQQSRVEWLIDALDHEDAEIRSIVARDLAQHTGQDLGYDPDLPPEKRQAIRERYRLWHTTQH
ncbi:MAG: HEAT repeat domain-containing protein [Polyangiales bacterium]